MPAEQLQLLFFCTNLPVQFLCSNKMPAEQLFKWNIGEIKGETRWEFEEEAECREAKWLQIFMELYFGQIVQSTDLATDLTTKYFGESSPY